jgi:Fe-S-cluster containining protein
MPPRQPRPLESIPVAAAVPIAPAKVPPVRVVVGTAEGALGSKISMSCADRTTIVPLAEVLSTLRSITNKVVDAAAERERQAGREISCRAGCGACCRQLVPLSRTEAQQLPDLVASLDPDHRERVMSRFEAAMTKLRESGMLSRLDKRASLSREEFEALVLEYFRLGIACPFLEEESCSIHAVRPLACRQYLVTSDRSHCANPSPDNISRVTIAADVSAALTRVERDDAGVSSRIPLILAMHEHGDQSDIKRTVPDWLSLIISQIEKIRMRRAAAPCFTSS